MQQEPITVLVVEDQQIMRLGLQIILGSVSDLKIVAEVGDGLEAVSKALELRPNVVLLDIGLPNIDGIEVAKRIKPELPGTRILMLTNHDHSVEVFAALAAGADGYCLKQAAPEQVVMAVRTVASGATWLDQQIASSVLHAYRPAGKPGVAPSAGDDRSKFALSARELEVLELMVEGLANKEIADRLIISHETVKSHVRHIMDKLVVSDRTQAAVKALREGLVHSA